MRRISNLGKYVSSKLKSRVKNCIYFSLALDESTGISDASELISYALLIGILLCKKNWSKCVP